MELNEKIRRLRLSNSLTQKELSARVGVSETSIKCWESGSKKPSAQKIILLCKVLGVSTDSLLGVSSNNTIETDVYNLLLSTSEKVLVSNYRALDNHGKTVVETVCELEKRRMVEYTPTIEPVISTKKKSKIKEIPKYLTPIAAGYSVPMDEDESEMIEIDLINYPDADFAVEISGNSMFPYIEDGDVVYVKRTSEIEIGDVGVFCVDGAMYCKQYYIDRLGNLTLVSSNPELRDSNIEISFESSSNIICYGKVLLGRKIPFPRYFRDQR